MGRNTFLRRHSQNWNIKFVFIIDKRILEPLIYMVGLTIKIRDSILDARQEFEQCTHFISKDSKILQT